MQLAIDTQKRDKLIQETTPRIQNEVKDFKAQNRKFTIKAAVIATAIILFIIAIIFLIHLLKSEPFTADYLHKHFTRFLIAEIVFVGIPIISDIFMSKQTIEDLMDNLGKILDDITYEITDEALIELQNSKEVSRYYLEDISDIRSEGNNVVFKFNESDKSIPDYFIPSLYESLMEAKENYIKIPERNSSKKVMPRKLKK